MDAQGTFTCVMASRPSCWQRNDPEDLIGKRVGRHPARDRCEVLQAYGDASREPGACGGRELRLDVPAPGNAGLRPRWP